MIGLLRRLLHLDEPVDPNAVRRDDQVIDHILDGRLDAARKLTDRPEFVDLLASDEFTQALLASWASNGGQR